MGERLEWIQCSASLHAVAALRFMPAGVRVLSACDVECAAEVQNDMGSIRY